MTDADWWATFFSRAARRAWSQAHTRAETRAAAQGIARTLGIGPDDEVLDVPCGEGRHALELAALGHHIHGLDLCAESLAVARAAAARAGLELGLTQGDMRRLPWTGRFSAAYCAGNSFGLFDDAENRAFLDSVARCLRPGGRFLLECPLVAELVGAQRLGRDWRLVGDQLVLSEAGLDERGSRLVARYTFIDLSRPAAREERASSHRVYAMRELVELVESVGLGVTARLGGLDGRAFGARSEECWLVASKA